jgi:hypothetical protein
MMPFADEGRKCRIRTTRQLKFVHQGARVTRLTKEVTVTHFEDDGVTPKPPNGTADEMVSLGFERYAPIFENVGSDISDHCPVKVWFLGGRQDGFSG